MSDPVRAEVEALVADTPSPPSWMSDSEQRAYLAGYDLARSYLKRALFAALSPNPSETGGTPE